MNKGLDAFGCGRARDSSTAINVHLLKRLGAALKQDRDEIDDGISAFNGLCQAFGVADVCLNGMDLANAAHGLQVACKVGTADGDAHAPAAPCKGAHRMAADESRAAKHDG
jgi:hypothetical protein